MQYDKFQQQAIDYIDKGLSVIVSAPTGAGKTVIAEYVIRKAIENDQGVIYTAPIKALSNQKFRDFHRQFPENTGILTGDVSINPYAPLLIMTTEIFRNKTIEESDALKRYAWIIFDEVHYIDNYERGTVWEESLIFLPRHINILSLSATIPNIEEFATWISNIRGRQVKIVREEKRPVPLHFFFQMQNEIVDNDKNLKFPPAQVILRHRQRLRQQRMHNRRQRFSRGRRPGYAPWAENKDSGIKPNRINTLIEHIRDQGNLPLIYFVFSRRRTEILAAELSRYDFLGPQETGDITAMFNDLRHKFDLASEPSAEKLYPLIKRGIAYHHAGMLPTLKEVIERLFTSRLLKVIFTTETFALGINMPARSVVLDQMKKFYGDCVRPLKTRDLFQMAGRAGRRGMDKEGFVYLRVNPLDISPDELRRIVYHRPEAIKSQLNNSYATILNLYDRYREDILKIYPYSFHFFQSNKHNQRQAKDLILAKIKLLKALGQIQNNALSEKGNFARTVYGYELILSELYQQGFLEQLDEVGLGILATAVVFEPRKNQHIFRMPKKAEAIKKKCRKTIDKIREREKECGITPLSKRPYFHLAAGIEAWIKGQDFDKTLSLGDTDEGEMVRYFRMAIQILREIESSPAASPYLKQRIEKTIRTINRDVIDAEKQLRE
ncbi:MAG: DEAD/DEAH box helicase [Candidatus Omnitrophota bacterium]